MKGGLYARLYEEQVRGSDTSRRRRSFSAWIRTRALKWFSAWLRVTANTTFDIEMAWTTAERTRFGQLLGSSAAMRVGVCRMTVSRRPVPRLDWAQDIRRLVQRGGKAQQNRLRATPDGTFAFVVNPEAPASEEKLYETGIVEHWPSRVSSP